MVLAAPRMRPFARDCGIVLSLLLSFTGNVRSQPPACSGGYRSVVTGSSGYCEPCPPGYYKYGYSYKTYCDPCPPGTNAVNAAAESCSSCPINQYSTGYAQFCTQCPDNSGNLAAGSASCFCNVGYTGPDKGTCSACAAGKYKTTLGSADCTHCDAGKYQTTAGSTGCTNCSAGSYSTTVGASVATTCLGCAADKISAAGADTCTLYCAADKYENVITFTFPSGIQTSYTPAADFYTKCQMCYDATYSSVTTIQHIETCKSQADEQGWIMMGSKKSIMDMGFDKAAFIKKSDFVTSSSLTTPYVSNGVYWYYVQSKSVGFTSETVLNLNPHDTTGSATIGTSNINICQTGAGCVITSNKPDQGSGIVSSLLDGNPTNLWYSGYNGQGHQLTIDLKATFYVEVIYFYPYTTSNYFANWDMQVGVEQSTMQYVFQNQPQVASNPLGNTINKPVRYIKITVNHNNYFAVNEITIYGKTYTVCSQSNQLSWNLDNSGGMRSGCETNLQSNTLWRKMLYTCPNPVCTSCPAGKSSPAGSDALDDCVTPECAAGSTGPNGGPCSACVAGKYKATAGSADCTDCLANSYHALTGRTAASACQCNAGTRVGVACACPLCPPALLCFVLPCPAGNPIGLFQTPRA